MFKNPFSFNGRIRRTEYGLSIIFDVIASVIVQAILKSGDNSSTFFIVFAYIPIIWFNFAQGAKRCHDVGNSGWWLVIPFYPIFLLLQDGEVGNNKYGENPKGV